MLTVLAYRRDTVGRTSLQLRPATPISASRKCAGLSKHWSATIAALGILYASGLAVASGDPVIDGDPGLLGFLREVQQANLGRYPHGEMNIDGERGALGPGGAQRMQMQVKAHLRWDGRSSRLDGVITTVPLKPIQDFDPTSQFNIIYDHARDANISYYPDSLTASISRLSKVGPQVLLTARPDERWYSMNTNVQWLDLLRPQTSALRTTSISIHKLDEDVLAFERLYENGTRHRLVMSLAADGNVVSYSSVNKSGTRNWQGTFDWGRNSTNDLYMKHSYHEGKGFYERMRVSDFNPTVRPPREIFRFETLVVKPGTFVSDELTGKNYRAGRPSTPSVLNSLDGLAEAVKSTGFARPGR